MHDTLPTATRLAGQLPGLLLEAEAAAREMMRGAHGRRRVGPGEAFWQFRPWADGDSRRDIDWRRTARGDDTVVRQKEWEAAQSLWLWRDASPSMDFSSSKKFPAKRRYAEVLLLALALLALEGGERVGLVGAELPAQAHAAAIARLAAALPVTNLAEARGRPVPARAKAVLLGDFYGDPSTLATFCADLAAREIKGLVVQLADPAEETFPYAGRIKFLDPSGAIAPLTVERAEAVKAEYLERFRAHRAALSHAARAAGWEFLSASTAEPPARTLAALHARLAVKPK